jgi:hypothetical protein
MTGEGGGREGGNFTAGTLLTVWLDDAEGYAWMGNGGRDGL